MANYSCTNQRYEYTPLRVEEINTLPSGTLLFRALRKDQSFNPSSEENFNLENNGNPVIFTQTLDLYSPGTTVETYVVAQDLAYIIGLPEDKGVDGLCWEYQPEEDFCFDDDLTIEFPHPLAWVQEPYFYICNFDNLEYLDTRLI